MTKEITHVSTSLFLSLLHSLQEDVEAFGEMSQREDVEVHYPRLRRAPQFRVM